MRLRLARDRLAISGACALVAGVVAAFLLPWQVASLLGWDVGAGVLIARVLVAVLPLDGARTEALAMREDNSRFLADVLLVAASATSLVGVGLTLLKSQSEKGAALAGYTALVLVTVLLSWMTVHTVYMLRYARLHYVTGGGVDFPGDEAPDYRDFAYLALTIGMTYQVSDTGFTNKQLRRVATHHALLSYLFGTVVVAVTINVVASLVR
ncbi:MAG TPA: DUF1345 domain-containing protein [Acidimicrobiales bacterium]|nr:DUF1345 domain-containing protein [Acidimicrobiales bacterium]